eukprot:4275412-Lingulodinium_polyedra.AAC.1
MSPARSHRSAPFTFSSAVATCHSCRKHSSGPPIPLYSLEKCTPALRVWIRTPRGLKSGSANVSGARRKAPTPNFAGAQQSSTHPGPSAEPESLPPLTLLSS